MIVKNEAHVIERCLQSVRPIIDSWSIVDTGSTDGTQDKIRAVFNDVPGMLWERPWKNFAFNRTESINLARQHEPNTSYGLIMDADDILEIPTGYKLPILTANSYRLRIEYGGTVYYRPHLISLSKPFRYEGVLHEYLECDGISLIDDPILEGVIYRCFPEGSRSTDPNKFLKDAEVLREALRREPQNARYQFYLAQSLKDAGKIEKAITAYEKRANMVGWVEETWMAIHEVARLKEWTNCAEQSVVNAYLRAFDFRPERVEPLYELARYYRTKKDRPKIAYIYAAAGYKAVRPTDRLMLDESIYQWRTDFEFAVSSWYAGKIEESRKAHLDLLKNTFLPPEERALLVTNMKFFTVPAVPVKANVKAEHGTDGAPTVGCSDDAAPSFLVVDTLSQAREGSENSP
jgi:glycosyltransferase involved in cell wall biosynthesis